MTGEISTNKILLVTVYKRLITRTLVEYDSLTPYDREIIKSSKLGDYEVFVSPMILYMCFRVSE